MYKKKLLWQCPDVNDFLKEDYRKLAVETRLQKYTPKLHSVQETYLFQSNISKYSKSMKVFVRQMYWAVFLLH